jgi:hypothetical protein
MKNDIYRSTVLGDERTNPIKTELPADEAEIAQNIEHLRALVRIGDNAIEGIRKFQRECPHHYFRDTAGFPYDVRTCAVCGASMGQV